MGDLKNFFESSVDFLPISVGKMRKDHGPSFNILTIKALLNLRTDLTKQEKSQVLKDSKEVLEQYKDEAGSSTKGIFSNLDTASAAKEFNEDMKDPEQEDAKEPEEEEEEFNLDDFLKEGGIDIDDLDQKVDKEEQKLAQMSKQKSEEVKVKVIVGREEMSGWLFKSNDDLKEDKALLDTVLYTVTDTFHSVVDNINKTRTKRFFRIKKGHLYWYTKQDADKAQNDLDIKKIDRLEICQENEKMILIVYQDKLYKLEADNKDYVEEWFKSIALVRSKSEEYLNLDRYVDTKVFERITGKSLFKDFEQILQEQFDKIEQEKKRVEEQQKKLRDAEVERELHKMHEKQAVAEKKPSGIKNKSDSGSEGKLSAEVTTPPTLLTSI